MWVSPVELFIHPRHTESEFSGLGSKDNILFKFTGDSHAH